LAKRRAAERDALRSKIKKEMLTARGVSQDSILLFDSTEINGNDLDVPISGMIGGVLGQLIICFNTVYKNFSKDEDDSEEEEAKKEAEEKAAVEEEEKNPDMSIEEV